MSSPRCSAECPAGTFCPLGSLLPTICTAGSSCSSKGTGHPRPCAPGTAAPPGASSCADCEAGTISNANHTACELCAVGTWAAPGSEGCTPCSAGKYSDTLFVESAMGCNPCGAGTASDSPGGSYCVVCEQGYYASNDNTE